MKGEIHIILGSFALLLCACAWAPVLAGQTASSSRKPLRLTTQSCPVVTPRNADEALQMQNASDHSGCWARSSDGSLRFLSTLAPDQSFKPIIGDTADAGAAPAPIKPTPGRSGTSDPSGTWAIKEGTWSGVELPLIRAFSKPGEIQKINGYDTVDIQDFRMTFAPKATNTYCGEAQGERVCLVRTGASTFAVENQGTQANHCVFIFEDAHLRGQCIQSATLQVLLAGTKISP